MSGYKTKVQSKMKKKKGNVDSSNKLIQYYTELTGNLHNIYDSDLGKRDSLLKRRDKNKEVKLKIASENIKYIIWCTSGIILTLFLAKRLRMLN